jgi:hypothetical protein
MRTLSFKTTTFAIAVCLSAVTLVSTQAQDDLEPLPANPSAPQADQLGAAPQPVVASPQAPAVQEQSSTELRAIFAQNQKILEQQRATLEKLKQLEETARMLRIRAKRN